MREEDPAVPGCPREAVLETGDLADGPRWTGGGELLPERGVAGQEALPGVVRRAGRQLFTGALPGDHEAGAHRSMVEREDVHPPFLQDVVDGRLLVRIRTGGERRAARDLGEAGHPFEVPEDQGGMETGLDRGDREVPGQEAARSGGVDQQIGLEADGPPLMRSGEMPAAGQLFQAGQIDLFQDLDPGGSGLESEVVIHVLPQPVGIGDGVRGAGGHQQTALVGGAVGKRTSRLVAVEGESPLEPPAQVREARHPATPGGEGVEVVEAIARGEALQADRGERSGGLAEGETGVLLPVEEEHPVPLDLEDAGEDRAREAGADDGDPQDPPPQAAQPIRGSGDPERFMRSSRARRASAQCGQLAKRRTSQRSAVTIPRSRERSRASSS